MEIEKQNQLLLGKILGEIYRLQSHMDISNGTDETHIYGLLNGFEHIIEEECERIGFIAWEKYSHTIDVLDEIFNDPIKMEAFKGFYDIEDDLKNGGVDRPSAMRILTYFELNNNYVELIQKINTGWSRSE